jgi:hypothetical protein
MDVGATRVTGEVMDTACDTAEVVGTAQGVAKVGDEGVVEGQAV